METKGVSETHNFRRETGGIGKVRDGVIEVVQICLVAGLKVVKEVEELEGEYSVWSGHSCRVPFLPKQLSTTVGGDFRSTPTVPNNNLMDTADVEDGQLITPRGVWTRLAGWMAELDYETEGAKELGGEELTIPSLQEADVSNHRLLHVGLERTSMRWRGCLECDSKRHGWQTKSSSKQSSQRKVPGCWQSTHARGWQPSPSERSTSSRSSSLNGTHSVNFVY